MESLVNLEGGELLRARISRYTIREEPHFASSRSGLVPTSGEGSVSMFDGLAQAKATKSRS